MQVLLDSPNSHEQILRKFCVYTVELAHAHNVKFEKNEAKLSEVKWYARANMVMVMVNQEYARQCKKNFRENHAKLLETGYNSSLLL